MACLLRQNAVTIDLDDLDVIIHGPCNEDVFHNSLYGRPNVSEYRFDQMDVLTISEVKTRVAFPSYGQPIVRILLLAT